MYPAGKGQSSPPHQQPRPMRLSFVPVIQCLLTTPITTLRATLWSLSRIIVRHSSRFGQILRCVLSVFEAGTHHLIIDFELASPHRDAQNTSDSSMIVSRLASSLALQFPEICEWISHNFVISSRYLRQPYIVRSSYCNLGS